MSDMIGSHLRGDGSRGYRELARELTAERDRARALLNEALEWWADTALCTCYPGSNCRSCAERTRIRRKAAGL